MPSAARSKIDRLTEQERRIIKARLEHPNAKLGVVARHAGLKSSPPVRRQIVRDTLARPQVKAALLHPPPTFDLKGQKPFDEMTDRERRDVLLRFYGEVVRDKRVAMSERIRAAKEVAEMTAGAKVPVGVHHSGVVTLEDFVAAAGGKPPDERAHEEMPN